MNLVPTTISNLVAKVDSPRLLFGLGIAGTIGSTVLACRATLEVSEVLHRTQHDLEIAKSIDENEYKEGESQGKDVAIIYGRSVVQITKLYAPSVLLGAASIGCLTRSHNILQERNLALTAAYAAVDEAFKTYRARVVDKYGEKVDRELRYELEDVEYEDDKGKVKKTKQLAGSNEGSMYAKFFDQYSSCWSKEPEYNMAWLLSQQNYWNNLLQARGHVFLNEVYDSLGLSRTHAGQAVGWLRDGDGDSYIDFGIFEGQNQSKRDFVNGREGAILLDFNVDGTIHDRISNWGEKLRWQS